MYDFYVESLTIPKNTLLQTWRPGRRALSCSSPELLSNGKWMLRRETPSWWQPNKCHMRIYEETSAMAVLNRSSALFVGGPRVKSYLDFICLKTLNMKHHHVQLCMHDNLANTKKIIAQGLQSLRGVDMIFLDFDWDEHVSKHNVSCAHLRGNRTSGGVDLCVRRDLEEAMRYIEDIEQAVSSIREMGYDDAIILFNEVLNRSSTRRHGNALRRAINRGLHISQTLRQAAVRILDVGQMSEYSLHGVDNDGKLYPKTTELTAAVSQAVLNILDEDVTANFTAYENRSNCALVSSAGYLANFEYGRSIDSADLVVRVGAGPTKGFERHVGARTDLRFLRFSVFDGKRGSPDISDTRLAVVMHDRVQSVTSVLSKSPQRHLVASKSVPFFHFHVSEVEGEDSAFSQCVSSSGKLRSIAHLSSGSLAHIVLSETLNICKEVKLYGFSAGKFPDAPYHYWSMGLSNENSSSGDVYRSREGWGHPFMEEQRCLQTSVNETADHILVYEGTN